MLGLLLLVTEGISTAPEPGPHGRPLAEVRIRGTASAAAVHTLDESATPRVLAGVAELAETAPGVHLRALGGSEGLATLSIRGSGGAQVGVSLFGVPLSGPGNPTVDLSSLPWWPGAQLKLTRSFSPASVAAEGWGGAIDVSEPEATPSAMEAWAGAGSYGTLRARGGVRWRGAHARLSVAYAASRSAGDYGALDPIATAATGRDVFADRAHNASARCNLLAVHTRDVKPDWMWRSFGVWGSARSELAGTSRAPLQDARSSTQRWMLGTELRHSAATTLAVSVYARNASSHSTDSVLEARVRMRPVDARSDVFAAGLVARAEQRELSARVDLSTERYAPAPEASRLSARAAADFTLARSERVRLTLAPRVSVWSDAEERASSGMIPSGFASLVWSPDLLTVSAHAGRAGRAPSFLELYGDDGVFRGNSALRPETAWLADVSARKTWKRPGASVMAEVAAFCTFSNDLIAWQPLALSAVQRAYNVDSARICGAEAELVAAHGPWKMRASYTYLDAQDREGHKLPGRATHEGHGDLSWSKRAWSAYLSSDAVGAIAADPSGDVVIPGRAFLHSGMTWVASPQFSLGAEVRNVLDLRAVSYSGTLGDVRLPVGDAFDFPLPGRTVFFWFRAKGDTAASAM